MNKNKSMLKGADGRQKKGTIPFSLVAVVILILSAFAVIYVAEVQDHWWQNSSQSSSLSMTGTESNEASYVTTLAVNAAMESLSKVVNSSTFWDLNGLTYSNFVGALEKNFGGEGAYTGQYLVTIPGLPSSVSLNVSAVPYEYNGVNSLGMVAPMTTPTSIRVSGSVPITILNPTTGEKISTVVSINKVVPTTIAFLIVSANRVNYDFTSQGAAMQIAHVILQSESLYNITPLPQNVTSALKFSVYLDEALIYRNTSNSLLNSYLNGLSPGQRSHISPITIYNALYGTDYPVYSQYNVDLEKFGTTFTFNGQQVNLQSTMRSYNVATYFDLSNMVVSINTSAYSRPYTLATTYQGEPYESANVYDINFYNFSFSIRASEANVVNPAAYMFNYTIKGMTRTYEFVNNGLTISQAPSIHNPYWFKTQFAGFLDPVSMAHLLITNSSGLGQSMFPAGTLIDVSVNNMEEGIFPAYTQIILNNIPFGTNLVTVDIKYPNNVMEEGKSYINVTSGSSMNVYVNTTNGIDMQGLWTLDMSYLQNTPRQLWLSRLSQLYASLMGYPFPPSLADFSFNNNTTSGQLNNTLNSYVTWANGFAQYVSQNELSISFEPNFQSYSMIEGILASINTWTQIATSMISINQKYGVAQALQELNFTFENVPIYYPDASSADIAMAYMEGMAAPGGLIESFIDNMNIVPSYISMYNDMQNFINNNANKLIADYGSLPTATSFTIGWIINDPTYNITQIAQMIFDNVSTWKSITSAIVTVLNEVGIPDSVIGMEAWLLAHYAAGEGIPISTFMTEVLPGNVSLYCNEISNIISVLDNITGMSDLASFTALLIGKFVFAANMSWSDYINSLSGYATQIGNIANQLNTLGINGIFGIAALALYKFAFEQNMTWTTYLNNVQNFLGTIVSIKGELQAIGVDNLWEGLAGIVLAKYFVDPNATWGSYLGEVNSFYLPQIKQLENDFSTLGINDLWGFGVLILAKYTLASDISWHDFLSNVTGFWMPSFMRLNVQFQAWHINSIAGFAAVLLGKFVLMPNSDWAGYFNWISTTGLSDVNSIMSSLNNIGIPDVWGLAAVVLGKFIYGTNETWPQYLSNATAFLSQISSIKSELQALGINGFAGLGALVLGKFIIGNNESWSSYLGNVNSILNTLTNLKSDFTQLEINDYLGFAAVIAAKYLFAENMSWSGYLNTINSYQGDIQQGIQFYKQMESKFGVGGTLLMGAAAVAGLYFAREYFDPNESISSFAGQVLGSGQWWFSKVQQFIGIFSEYGNMPEAFRLMFQVRDMVNLVDQTSMFFIKGGNGVFSILPTQVWSDIHEFIQTYLSSVIQVINIVQDGLSAYTATLNIIESWKDFANWTNPVQVLTLLKNTVEVLIQDAQFLEEIANFLNLQEISHALSDAINVMQEIASDIAQIADVVASVAVVVEMFQQELTIDHGNVGKALMDLFFGFNLNSAMWYFALSSAFGALGTFFGSSVAASLGIGSAALASTFAIIATALMWIGIAVLIIWIIFNWGAFMSMLFGNCNDPSPSVTDASIMNMESEISSTLQKTLYMSAGLNGMRPSAIFGSSASAAAEMFAMANVAGFTLNPTIANAYRNSSMWEQDYSYTLFVYGVEAKSTRWSIMNFWESVLDLVSRNTTGTPMISEYGKVSSGFAGHVTVSSSGLLSSCTATYTHPYAGNIYLQANTTNGSYSRTMQYLDTVLGNANDSTPPFMQQTTSDVEHFLTTVNMSIAQNITVEFKINAPDGKVIATQGGNGLPHWAKELNVAGEDLTHWNTLLTEAKAKLSYVENFGNSSMYTESLGMMDVYMAPSLTSVQLTVTSDTGSRFFYMYNMQSGYADGGITVTASNSNGMPFYLYLSPGTYTVTWGHPSPSAAFLSNPATKTVTIYPFSSDLFYSSNNTVNIDVQYNLQYSFSVNDTITPAMYNASGFYKHWDSVTVYFQDPYTGQNITLLSYTGVFNSTGGYFNVTMLYGKPVTMNSLPANISLPVDAVSIPYSFNTTAPVQDPIIYISFETNISGTYTYNGITTYINGGSVYRNVTVDPFSVINPYNPPSKLHCTLDINDYFGPFSGTPSPPAGTPSWWILWEWV